MTFSRTHLHSISVLKVYGFPVSHKKVILSIFTVVCKFFLKLSRASDLKCQNKIRIRRAAAKIT